MPFVPPTFLAAALLARAPGPCARPAALAAALAPAFVPPIASAPELREPQAGREAAQDPAPSPPPAVPALSADELALLHEKLVALLPELGAVDGPLTSAAIESAVLRRLAARDGIDGAVGRTHAALEARDWVRARDLLSEVLAREEIASARAELRAGASLSALERLERAVSFVPRDAEALLLRGEARMRVANDRGDRTLLEDALSDFVASDALAPSAAACYDASSAARALGRTEQAREHALRGLQLARAGGQERAPPSSSDILPQRTIAEASCDAYLKQRATDPDSKRTRELFREARTNVEAWLGRAPDDPLVWNELARLKADAGDALEAQRVAERGLGVDRQVACEPLLETLARAAEQRGGRESVIEVFARQASFAHAAPELRWYPAQARYSIALERFAAGEDARTQFGMAESSLEGCRGLDEPRTRVVEAQILTCRAGRGWSALRAGELEAARDAFLSMKELAPDALARALDARIDSGVQGLAEIAAAFERRGEDVTRPDAVDQLTKAARIHDELAAAQKDDVEAPRRAAALHREAALALEDRARRRTNATRDAINAELASAREYMEQSYRACVTAAERAPDDVRTLADAGGILARYLQRDAAEAVRWLQQALDKGETQVRELRAQADNSADSTQREQRRAALEALEIALGDACESLGIVALTLQGDALAAQKWFERALTHGRDPREDVRGKQGWLEKCRAALASGADARTPSEQHWAAPLPEKK